MKLLALACLLTLPLAASAYGDEGVWVVVDSKNRAEHEALEEQVGCELPPVWLYGSGIQACRCIDENGQSACVDVKQREEEPCVP